MALDSYGHIKFSASDIAKSKDFYDKLLVRLGFVKVADYPDAAGWKNGDGFGVWLESSERKELKQIFGTPGFHHFCFKAKTREEVDRIYGLMKSLGARIFDSPAAYPKYTPDYYAVFFADPDGAKLEVAYY